MMSWIPRHWTAQLLSQGLCVSLFLQSVLLSAGALPVQAERPQWVSAGQLAQAASPAPAEPSPEPPVEESPDAPPQPFSVRWLTDDAPAVEEAPAPSAAPAVELPPFPPGMKGATLSTQAASGPALLTAASLVPGWNLASVQNQPPDPSPAAVFSSIAGQATRVYAYDACTPADPWKVYDPADAAGSDLTVIGPELGLWIEMTSPAPVPNPGTLPDQTAIHLCPGWNLIGFPAAEARGVRTALASIEGKYTRVFGFDPADAADPWELYDVAIPSWANDLDLLRPGRGYWLLATAETDLVISNVGGEPELAIVAPADLAVVTAPTEIVGTVTSDRLQSWALSYRPHGAAESTVFASGTIPVLNGRLGVFDPTLLLNGGYTLELTATDLDGTSFTISTDVSVEGQMKIGLFTLTFSDLEVALAGLPIEILRTYDSRDTRQGDFGAGWSLELRQGSYRNNRKPGDGWQFGQSFLPCDSIGETRGHRTTIRLSDREIYRFKLSLYQGVPTLGGCFARAKFDFVDGPVPGATLEILGKDQVLSQNGANEVVDPDTLAVYEPQQVRLTTRDGRVFDLDLLQGVTRVEDLNGNTLSLTPGGITHSSGRTVTFERDGLGRITRITDPEGVSLTYVYDAAGDLVEVRDREDQATRFTYDSRHLLLQIEDARGIQPIRNEYDASGRVVRHIDAFGKEIAYTHDLAARREIVTDRTGASRALEYDDRGNVIRELDALQNETVRTFDAKDRLLTETDPLVHTTRHAYDGAGNLLSTTDPLGHETAYTYNARGQVLTVRDARGKVTENQYDAQGNLALTRDALGEETAYTYDAQGNPLTLTDSEGGVTQFAYDPFGQLLRQIDALGQEAAYTYDATGNRLSETTTRTLADGGAETLITQHRYDKLGRLVETVHPDGAITRNVYDALGQLLESLDPLNRKTTYRYDALGRQVETTLPDGTSEKRGYDAEGRLVRSEDRGGRVTTYVYDAAGRLIRANHPDGTFTESTFDAAGRLVVSTDARRKQTRSVYDKAGRRIQVVDPLGGLTDFEYDVVGNQIAVTDANRIRTRFEYDDLNRLVRTLHPDGTERTTEYDRLGRRTAETDPAQRTTRFSYDALGRLTQVTDALGQETRYGYDELGNRISQTDANRNTTRFVYDSAGRMTKRILPDGSAEEMTYDVAGSLKSRKDFAGRVTLYDYDSTSRLTRRSYPDGTSVSFTYTATGRRQSVTDARGATTYAYDLRDRLTSLTYPDGRQLTYAYDANGNRTGLTAHVAGQTLSTAYTYDSLNRLDQVTDPRGRIYDHGYDANGNRTSLLYPNGTETTWSYDAQNRLRELTTRRPAVGEVLQSYTYTLGAAGNRTRIDEHDGTSRAYGYDDLYRLVSETVTGGAGPAYQKAFTYDSVGNRLRQTHTDSTGTRTTDYSYDIRDRLLTNGGTTSTWDANGNLTGKTSEAAYTWDFENRLQSVTLADGTVVTHAYDADGNRVRTEVTPPTGPPTVTNHLVDSSGPLSHVVAETDGTGNLTAFYVRGDDLLAVLRPTGDRFYHADGLGSIRVLTDEAGEVTDRYTFSAFGELLAHAGSDPNAYLFAGEPLDPNSGFYYLRARWMDPGVGLFVSADTFSGVVSDPRSLHKYLYAYASPTLFTDPTGLFSISEVNIAQMIQGVVMVMNAISLVTNVNQSISAGFKVRKALREGKVWDAVAYASIAALHIGLAALSIVGLTTGMSPPPSGLSSLVGSLAGAGGGQVQIFYQVIRANPKLAEWVTAQVIPVVLSAWVAFSQGNHDGGSAGLGGRGQKPRIENGNDNEGWVHINNRHILGADTKGAPGDLFPPNTTRDQLQRLAGWLVEKGVRISNPLRRIQVYERRGTLNGQYARFRVIVDSGDGNRVITIFPNLTGN